ncbi:MAG: hypothetical protein IJF07_07000 [Lachnospiraceae bacterium]|nr:hypothetical protein [Lachnospiraceae bacterium]
MKNIIKKKRMHFLHKLAIVILIVLGLSYICNPEVYKKELGTDEGVFLHEGDYGFSIHVQDSPAGNTLIVCSDVTNSPENIMGTNFVEIPLQEGNSVVDTMVHLEQSVQGLYVKTMMDTEETKYAVKTEIQSVQLLDKDNYFLGMLCFVLAVVVAVLGLFVSEEKYRTPVILIGLGVLASLPLFADYVCTGSDFYFHVARIEGIYQGLKAGEFPVRINSVQTKGFGNLSATMYPQLFLYPSAFLRLLGISTMLSYKLLLVFINIATATISFYAIKKITKSDKAGYIMSVVYTFSLYRFTSLYMRVAIGEALAMVFFPLVIWGIYEILWGEKKKWYLLAFGISGVIQSHVLSLEICVFFLGIEVIVWFFHRKTECLHRILSGIKAAILTILLNAGFLFPFLYFSTEDLHAFHITSDVGKHAIFLSQMFVSFPTVTGSSETGNLAIGEMPLTVGGIMLLGVVVFCVVIYESGKPTRVLQVGKHCLGMGLISLWFASRLFPWESAMQLDVFSSLVTPLQFAWRFLAPATVFLSVVSAIGIWQITENRQDRSWVYALFAVMVIGSAGYFFDMMAKEGAQFGDKMEMESITSSDSMYMYEKNYQREFDFTWDKAYITTLEGTSVQYQNYKKIGSTIYVEVVTESAEEDYLLFPLYYISGYEIFVNDQAVPVYSINDLVACQIPLEEATIKVQYRGIDGCWLADTISLLTAISMIIVKVCGKRKKVCEI